MDQTASCPDCGCPIAVGTWGEDLCPQCLLQLALAESPGLEEETLAREAVVEATGLLSKGRVIGNRYGIRQLLGRGGMGEVWRAFDLKLRVDVALKTVRPDMARQQRVIETLRQEVRAAREVVSPNVCRVHDLQEIDGRELVTMEYVDGTTLSRRLEERGPLGLQEAREIAAQFLAGLDAIHQAGLVHRDIKPENVMLTRTGRVVVMDFGLAKALGAARTGTVVGTPAYMAPEQTRGETVDARADVFSAGVVLAEMLASPGRAPRKALWRGVRQDPPEVPDSPWRRVIEVAVDPQPERRYAAAAALARALEEVTVRVEGAEDVVPYPGLVAFSEENRDYFFGRELEAEAVWKRLRKLHLLALIGPSGAGKTSFLRAGLLPSAPQGWSCVVCTPGEAPVTALRKALVPELSGDSEAIQELVNLEDPQAMVSAVSLWRRQAGHVLVVVDQFEELFTLNPPDVQADFASLLGRLAVEADAHVLLSLRDDFLVQCHGHEALKPIQSELTLLGPPVGAALRRAIVQPALKCGYRFEDEALVDRMLSEVEGERAALPLLAFCAERLWERRDRKEGLLTREAYEVIGGVSGALAQHAELTLERIGSERAPIVRELFRNLVTSQGTRAVRDRDELLSVFPAGERDEATRILDTLTGARLLTTYGVEAEEEDEPLQRIEIVHESLLTAWPRLVRWQAQDVEGARMRDDLRQAARRWQERERPDDLLWTGSAYREFQLWRGRYAGSLSEIEEHFAKAMAAHESRTRRRKRLLAIGAFLALAATAIAIGISRQEAVTARDAAQVEARRAEAARLVALGRLELDRYPTAAVAYARKSLELADSAEARRFAVEALWRGPTARILPVDRLARELGVGASRNVLELVNFSPDGRWLATSDMGGGVLLFPRDGGPPRALPAVTDRRVSALDFSAQSDLLATGGSHASLVLWSVPDLVERRAVELGGVFSGASIRGDNLYTLTWPEPGTSVLLRLWSLPGAEPRGEEGLVSFAYDNAALDPTGSWFALTRGPTVAVRRVRGTSLEPERVLGRHPDDVTAAQFVGTGAERVASLDASGEIRLWSLAAETGAPLRVLKGERSFLYGPDPEGRLLATSGKDSSVYVWDLESSANLAPLLLQRPDLQTAQYGAFEPAGRWLASTNGTDVAFWPLAAPAPRVLPRDAARYPKSLAFTPDGHALALAGSIEDGLRLWPLAAHGGEARLLASGSFWDAEMDPSGRYVLAAAHNGQPLTLVPTGGGEPRYLDGGWGTEFSQGTFDAVGRRVIGGPLSMRVLEDAQRTLHVWDLDTGAERTYSLAGVTSPEWKGVFWMQASPDGSVFLGGEGGIRRLTLPDALEGDVTSEVVYDTGPGSARFVLSHNGRRLLAWGTRRAGEGNRFDELRLFDLAAGSSRVLESHGSDLYFGALDATGSIVVSGGMDGVVRVGPATGEEPHLLFGHAGPITALAVSGDGRWIASASQESVRLWAMPDVARPPFHTLPYDELLAKLRALTNLEVVADNASNGYRVEVGPFPGWAEMPTW